MTRNMRKWELSTWTDGHWVNVGKRTLARSWPPPKPWVSHLFLGQNVRPNNSHMRIGNLRSGLKHQALLLPAKVEELLSDLARSDVPWTQDVLANPRLLFITNYEHSLKTRRTTQQPFREAWKIDSPSTCTAPFLKMHRWPRRCLTELNYAGRPQMTNSCIFQKFISGQCYRIQYRTHR